MELRYNLKNIRKENGYTQLELANKLGVSDKTVSGWEQGIAEPSIAHLRNMSKIYGCSIDYIISMTPSDTEHLSSAQQLLMTVEKNIDSLDDKALKLLSYYVEVQKLKREIKEDD